MFPLPLIALLLVQSAPQVDEQDDILSFSYAWPAELDSVPGLRRHFRTELDRDRRQARQWAREGEAERGDAFNAHYYAKSWEIRGRSEGLLSLTGTRESFAGGAHGNQNFSVLLWDLRAGRASDAAAVLGRPLMDRLGPRYCRELDRQRAERRAGEVEADPDDPFAQCPPIAEQLLAPADADADGRFDRLDVVLGPYVAGPYVEGAYEVEIPLEAGDLAVIPERWRDQFESGPGAPAASTDCPETDMDLPRGAGSACIGRSTERYVFAFAWPAEAASIPAVDRRLRAAALAREASFRQQADRWWNEQAENGGTPEQRSTFEQGWSVDAHAGDLVALSSARTAYAGGAHGSLDYETLLLDLSLDAELRLAELFSDPEAGLRAVQSAFCPALLEEFRQRERDNPPPCPDLASRPVTFVGVHGGGPIRAIRALLAPYVVGSWAEGPYEIDFAPDAAFIAALKPRYRAAFAPS